MPQPPKMDPARRNARVGPLKLPAEGRKGKPPPWPLPGLIEPGEMGAWEELWRTPQAVAWEKLGWVRTVGRYCRLLVQGEKHGAPAALLAQITALEDRLGLTPKAMRLLLWEIAADEISERRVEPTSVRDRIKAV